MNILSQTVPIQFDTAYSPYDAKDWREAFAAVKKQGLTGVEIAVARPAEVDTADLLREAIKNGLTITTISTGQICGLDGQFLTAKDAKARARAALTVLDHIRMCEKIGRPNVTIGLIRGGFGVNSGTTELLADMLHPLCQAAKEAGVVLQIEPINHEEVALLNSTQETLDFIAMMGAPVSLGLLFDTYHAAIEDGDVCQAARKAYPYITNVHLADTGRLLPCEGEIAIAEACRALIECGYGGTFALEAKCVPSREHVLTHYGERIIQATK